MVFQSIEMLSGSKKSLPIIFFITDGAIEDERQICEVMRKQLRSQGSEVCPRICTFGIGNNIFIKFLRFITLASYNLTGNIRVLLVETSLFSTEIFVQNNEN